MPTHSSLNPNAAYVSVDDLRCVVHVRGPTAIVSIASEKEVFSRCGAILETHEWFEDIFTKHLLVTYDTAEQAQTLLAAFHLGHDFLDPAMKGELYLDILEYAPSEIKARYKPTRRRALMSEVEALEMELAMLKRQIATTQTGQPDERRIPTGEVDFTLSSQSQEHSLSVEAARMRNTIANENVLRESDRTRAAMAALAATDARLARVHQDRQLYNRSTAEVEAERVVYDQRLQAAKQEREALVALYRHRHQGWIHPSAMPISTVTSSSNREGGRSTELVELYKSRGRVLVECAQIESAAREADSRRSRAHKMQELAERMRPMLDGFLQAGGAVPEESTVLDTIEAMEVMQRLLEQHVSELLPSSGAAESPTVERLPPEVSRLLRELVHEVGSYLGISVCD